MTGSHGRKGGTLTQEAMTIIRRLPKLPKSPIPDQRVSLVDPDPPGGMEDMHGDR